MLGLAIPWLVIIGCFLIGAIVNVIEGEKLNVLKPKYRKKHQEGETNDVNKNCSKFYSEILGIYTFGHEFTASEQNERFTYYCHY